MVSESLVSVQDGGPGAYRRPAAIRAATKAAITRPIHGEFPAEPPSTEVNIVYLSELTPDGRRVVCGSSFVILVWDAETGLAARLNWLDWVMSVAVTPDGRRIVSEVHDKKIRVLSTRGEFDSRFAGQLMFRVPPQDRKD